MIAGRLLDCRFKPNDAVCDRIFRVNAKVNELRALHSQDFRIFSGASDGRSGRGAEGGTRTLTPSLAPDFESGASTSSTTPAGRKGP